MQIQRGKAELHTDAWLKEVYEQRVCQSARPYVFIEMNI